MDIDGETGVGEMVSKLLPWIYKLFRDMSFASMLTRSSETVVLQLLRTCFFALRPAAATDGVGDC